MRRKQAVPHALWAFMLLSLLLAGCGTLDANVHLTFTGDGKLSGRMNLAATGALGNMLAGEESGLSNFDKEIWDVRKERKGEAVVLTAETKAPRPVEMLPLDGGQGPWRDAQFQVGGNPFVRTYKASLTMQPSAPGATSPSPLLDLKTMSQMLDAAFKLSFAITMPGEITASNADSATSDTATWLFNYTSLTGGRTLEVESRQVQWGNIGGGVLAVGGLAAGGAWWRSRGQRSDVPDGPPASDSGDALE